ncbi:MAG: hypothetical protein KDH96_04720 [Candidatus Riesia sp.]|nr:hypothetical protein [Candidatus Riesia sp.]HRV76450.1 hypothetical protein [Candidatus Saccharimonadales bacterium]
MNLSTHRVSTALGKVSTGVLPFLSEEELEELNTIGYTGKNSKGVKTNRQQYLNTLNKGVFLVEQTKFDNGDFTEEFLITRSTE